MLLIFLTLALGVTNCFLTFENRIFDFFDNTNSNTQL
jgi:hypothetical protein